MEKIITNNAPAAIGPYSQAIKVDNFIFTSGQIPLSPETGEIIGFDIKTQSEQVMKNLKAILEAAGSCLDNTVKTTCYLSDMSYFGEFNQVYEKYFTQKPARSCVAVKSLPKDVLCEIEVLALLNSEAIK